MFFAPQKAPRPYRVGTVSCASDGPYARPAVITTSSLEPWSTKWLREYRFAIPSVSATRADGMRGTDNAAFSFACDADVVASGSRAAGGKRSRSPGAAAP